MFSVFRIFHLFNILLGIIRGWIRLGFGRSWLRIRGLLMIILPGFLGNLLGLLRICPLRHLMLNWIRLLKGSSNLKVSILSKKCKLYIETAKIIHIKTSYKTAYNRSKSSVTTHHSNKIEKAKKSNSSTSVVNNSNRTCP